jgi:hypothetical protein
VEGYKNNDMNTFELTGVPAWIANLLVMTIICGAGLMAIYFISQYVLTQVLKMLGALRTTFEYAAYRKKFKKWLKEHKNDDNLYD